MAKYYKQWKAHPAKLKAEGEPVGWFEVTQSEVFEHLEGNVREYTAVDSSPSEINTKLIRGDILHSCAAMYIAIPHERSQNG